MNAAQGMSSAVHRLRLLVGLESGSGAEPSESLFEGIRWRLTLWYSAVLAAALLLAGVLLYFSVRDSLFGPIKQDLQSSAQLLSQEWQNPFGGGPFRTSTLGGCPVGGSVADYALFVCYDTNGNVLKASDLLPRFSPSILTPSLVNQALRDGQAGDTMRVGGQSGAVERYAVAVPALNGRGTLGVIQVATPVESQLQTLDTLLRRLLLIGAFGMLFAVIGGLFLANRALLPARLAHKRQRDFIADASHELRTPLTMLRSNVEVVLRGRKQLPPEDVALLEDTILEAKHLTTLANSMLDLARLDQEGVHLEQDIVDLVQLAGEVGRWAGSLAAEHGLAIRADGAGSVLVVGDRALLEQAVMTLIDNAIKYNRPGGEVTVRAWMDERQAYIEVRDTGIGIESSHLAHLGERFYRVDKARSRESGGAGLGLSIVRRIAARHGGSFQLVSEPGQGTTARLSLPAVHTTSRASPVIQEDSRGEMPEQTVVPSPEIPWPGDLTNSSPGPSGKSADFGRSET